MTPPGDSVRELFDDNAATYDRVNTIISLGLDSRWRRWAATRAVRRPAARVLDAFAGTGLVGLAAARLGGRVTLADVSEGMLAVAGRRARAAQADVTVVVKDLTCEPAAVPGEPFDAITIVFGARYLDDPSRVMRSLSQLLVPGGRLVVVDFAEPCRGWPARAAWWYFSRVLPSVAGALAGHRELYDRLVSTTRRMDGPRDLATAVADAGLDITERATMGFGIVTGLVATRG